MKQGGIDLRDHLLGVDVKRWNLARLCNILLAILYTCHLQLLDDMLHFGSCGAVDPELG